MICFVKNYLDEIHLNFCISISVRECFCKHTYLVIKNLDRDPDSSVNLVPDSLKELDLSLVNMDPLHWCSGSGTVGSVRFGPPGSGSVIICKDLEQDPDPYINKQKKLRKTLISTVTF
jgi:hypothetical protein